MGRTSDRDTDLTIETESLRAADAAGRATDELPSAKPKKHEEESISLFWRLFGGTILSITALGAITLYNNLSGSISELRADLARMNEAKGEFAKKDDVNAVRLQATGYAGYRAEIDSLKERLSKHRTELEDTKKAQASALDVVRKDVAGIDAIKERLLALTADLKSAKDDLVKVRTDVDKNQAADLERRDQRTAQMKQLEDLLKDLSKAVQETREKVARLEGLAGPVKPPADPTPTPPKGPNRPKPATPTGGDKN